MKLKNKTKIGKTNELDIEMPLWGGCSIGMKVKHMFVCSQHVNLSYVNDTFMTMSMKITLSYFLLLYK